MVGLAKFKFYTRTTLMSAVNRRGAWEVSTIFCYYVNDWT